MTHTILMYHDISPDRRRARFAPFVVTPTAFAQQMDYLAGLGVRVCSVSELANARAEDGDSISPMIGLTFDDAFYDLLANALPVIRQYGFGATVYAPTAYLGSTSRWLNGIGEGDRRIMSATQLGELAEAGIECGSHTHTHPKLDALPEDAVRRELELSKRILEDALGLEIRSFAYPYGYEVKATRRLVAEAGYDSACRVNYATSPTDEDVYALSRLPVFGGADLDAFASLVGGRTSFVLRRAIAFAWQRLRLQAAALQSRRATRG